MTDLGRHQKLHAAELLEQVGQFDLAEKFILEVLEELDTDKDRATVGALHINLGAVARQAGRTKDSIRYFTRAIELLEGLKGDSIVQCAHAHFNLATTLYHLCDQRDEDAVEHSERALELYKQFTFVEETDVVDARIAAYVSRVAFTKSFNVKSAMELWRDMQRVPFERLTKRNVLTFVVLSIRFVPPRGICTTGSMLEECRDWAGNVLTDSVEQQLKNAASLSRPGPFWDRAGRP
jgi:tetratricopeptide (TPR) repeat protein